MKNEAATIVKLGLNQLVLGASLIAALSACTKQRPADINDDETKSQIFAISDLQGKQYNIQTGVALQSMADLQNEPHALAEKPQVEIKSSDAPARLKSIFTSLPISAQSGQNYPVRLSVDTKAVTLFRIVSNMNDLTDIEKGSLIQQNVLVNKASQRMNLVPMAQMVVKDYGTLCRIKNDYGESTSNLKICHTDFKSATHVQISLKGDDLQAALGQHQMDQVFLKNRLNGKITTLSALQQQMKFSLYPVTDDKVVTYTQAQEGSQINLLIYKITKKSLITDDKLLQKLNSNIKTGLVTYCPQEVLATLSADDQKDCVLTLAYQVKGDAVRAETQTTDDLGRPGVKVELKKTASSTANLVQFDEAVPVETVNPTAISELNPYNTIRVVDVMNKEFMMRRTFEDAASTLTGFGPGASGYMDMVKFELQDSALVVRRVTVVNGARNASNIDKEEVMSIPASYLKMDPVTAKSIAPKLIPATKYDAQYIKLDWTANTISATNSPLSYASDGPEMCFKSTSRQDVTDLDNRAQDGVLSFSINGSYSFQPDCATFNSLNDYWYGGGMQSNFNIKERVSFMVNKGTQDNNPGISVAFKAQNTLGYGVFTMDQITPDQYGNHAGTVGSENPLPVIYDFSNGRQLIYHLGGLPDDHGSWEYTALVDGTREVVADWNKALHRAFVGTALDRSGDFIVLKVDGIDDTVGHLGDLDRSYIWNFTKNMDSGLLGLSQAAPNPRSGRIEQNNVLMYGGNLIGEIGVIRSSVKKQLAYHQWRDGIFADLVKQASPLNGAENNNAPTDDANSGLDVSGASPVRADKPIIKNLAAGKTAKLVKPRTTRLTDKNSLAAAGMASLPRLANSLVLDKSLQAKKKQFFAKMTGDISFENIIQQAVDQGVTRDSNAMTALVDMEMLKSGNLSTEQKQSVLDEARRLMLISHFDRNFNKGANCITSAEDIDSAMTADKDLLDDSKTADIFKRWYKATLAHEMGHSLGLTHNFEGSFDKPNFLFADEKESKTSRNYSSIMDYVPDQYQHYAGPGPYDVRALRVAYTGMIEISPTLASSLKDDGHGGKALVSQDGTHSIAVTKASDDFYYEIPLEAYRQAELGNQGWWRLDASHVKQLKIKPYSYCTDKDIGTDPLCNRWDMGTTESDIVKFYVAQYNDGYANYNTRGDDLIKMPSRSRYIGNHILRNFFGIRPFMEEGFYRVWYGKNNYTIEQKNAAYDAGIEGYKFFLQLASAPTEADLNFGDADRIHLFQYQGRKGLENIMIETKPMEDVRVPGSDFELSTRGIEDDRGIALSFLTKGGLGGPRYNVYGMGPTYFSLEESVLGMNHNNSLLTGLFEGLLSENPPSFVVVSNGDNIVALPSEEFHSDNTLNFRFRTQISAIINLENTSPTDDGNSASMFRVASSQNSVPKDRISVAKVGQSATSAASMKFWALDNANVASNVVRAAAAYRRYSDNLPKISGDLAKLYRLSKARHQAARTNAAFQKAAFTGNPDVDLKNSLQANAVRTQDVVSQANFDAQANQTLVDLIALNSDGVLLSSTEIGNIQANYKKQSGADVTADQAQKLFFGSKLNEAIEYMGNLEDLARKNSNLSPEALATPESQAVLKNIRDEGFRLVQQNAIIGVAQDAILKDKMLPLESDDLHMVVDNLAATKLISLMVYSGNIDSAYGLISRNLETMNQLLFSFHPEMNRY
jgi:hypothetical protein